jgi:diheme cytochrome c
MSAIRKATILWAAVLLIFNGVICAVSADDEHGERRRYRERNRHHSENHGESRLKPVNDPAYKENCGACHFAYQPGLLPSGSWQKILSRLEDHFGEVVEIDPESRKIISGYLTANAAEHSSAKRAVKIMRSLRGTTPLRITEVPYIRKKHHEIRRGVLERESIGSLSRCNACHRTAESGIYDDDSVSIPK